MAVIEPQRDNSDPALNAPEDSYADSVVSAFQTLMAGLSPELQERVRAKLAKTFPQNQPPRAGQVLGTILKLVPRNRAFTIEEVKQKVESDGVQATAKAIYNALGYLTRKHKIQRVGHGRYIIDGALIEGIEDLGVGPPTRHEIDDT